MSQWVEDEIVLPSGPFAGLRYRHYRHPASKLWFREIDSGKWSRFAATAGTQQGKTLMCYIAPVLYHLFEMRETVVIGIPSMEMANDKWQQDFLPVIHASGYSGLMPSRGEGSRGGEVKRMIAFSNGACLRFMTGGGSDKSRAGFTTRIVAVTETDGLDESGPTSREADKIEQMEGRADSWGRTGKRVYLECTTSITTGRIWQEIKQGSDSRLARPCPHCQCYVTPEREHLGGWETAESEEDAAKAAYWFCPECGEAWSESDRADAAEKIILVHHGQEVTPEGEVVGEPPATQTLGFRWSAIDNPFVTAADLGAKEWKARKDRNRENAEKKMRQFTWALPYESPDIDLIPLDPAEVAQRQSGCKKGIVPAGCTDVVVGVDTGKRELHWQANAVDQEGNHIAVIDYGKQTVESEKLGTHQGLVAALKSLHAYFETGWGGMRPSQVWIDSAYHEHTDAVYAFCMEANKGSALGTERYRPTKGYGEGQRRIGCYRAPSGKSGDVLYVGKEFYIAYVRRNGKRIPGVTLVHMNADHWKSELHQGLSIPKDQPGAIVLYEAADQFEHSEWTNGYAAERQREKFVPGKGTVIVWDREQRYNHPLDAGYAALVACRFVVEMRKHPKRSSASDRPTAAQLAGRK